MERLWTALELSDLGVQMLEQRLRRQRPGISEPELNREVEKWLHERPGAEHGDAEGVLVSWPRRSAPLSPKR